MMRNDSRTSAGGDTAEHGALPDNLEILLLEDNVLDAELTCATLELGDAGCRIERVEDKPSFEAALARKCFDLILADYSLPSFDGVTALEIAKVLCPDTPFIFVSGALGEELAIETLKRGATDYVLKHRLERLRPSVLRALREQEDKQQRLVAEGRLRELAAENARLYEQARLANRSKDEFIAMISHELRTPMTSILGWTRLLKMGGLSDEEFSAAVEAVERSASVQARLIDDLLDVSRISTGKMTLELETVALQEVVNGTIDALRIPAAEKSVSVITPLRDEPVVVRGDRNRLQQVVSNLVQNAIKFTPDGGRVDVAVAASDDTAEIRVSDTGKGIRAELIDQIFEPFRQDESGLRKGGLGLGLSIVRYIVERHGGTIAAESPGEGLGATFHVKLPLVTDETSVSEEHREAGEMPDLTGVAILLVEDNDATRSFVSTVLLRCGAEVTAADSVPSAMDVLEARQWDLIITDIAMPGADGYVLLAHIRSTLADPPPVAALTAFGSVDDKRRMHEAGFVRHMLKPIDPLTFARTVAALV